MMTFELFEFVFLDLARFSFFFPCFDWVTGG